MSFRLVPISVTLNYLERRNGSFRDGGALRKSTADVVVNGSRSLSQLLVSLLFVTRTMLVA